MFCSRVQQDRALNAAATYRYSLADNELHYGKVHKTKGLIKNNYFRTPHQGIKGIQEIC